VFKTKCFCPRYYHHAKTRDWGFHSGEDSSRGLLGCDIG